MNRHMQSNQAKMGKECLDAMWPVVLNLQPWFCQFCQCNKLWCNYIIVMIPGWWFGTFFIFHNTWDVILPIDELHHFSRWWNCTTNQIQRLDPDASRHGTEVDSTFTYAYTLCGHEFVACEKIDKVHQNKRALKKTAQARSIPTCRWIDTNTGSTWRLVTWMIYDSQSPMTMIESQQYCLQ